MKKWFQSNRSGTALFLAAVISVCSAFPAFAADGSAFLQGSRTEEDRVIVYCSSLADGGQTYAAEQFQASVGGQETPVLSVAAIQELQEGVTFYCLVDVSGSMYEAQMEQAKQALSAICRGLGEHDNMVIGELGEKLEKVTGFLTDKAEIQGVIDGLYAYSNYTDLYGVMTDSLLELKTNKSSHQKKCLVVISDGDDVSMAGKTRSELLTAIETSTIPVYTVAALRNSDSAYVESAKNLGEFARQSVGGRHYAPLVEGISADEAGRQIAEDNHRGVVLTLDTSKVQADRDELLLNVQFQTDAAAYNDTRYLYASDLQFSEQPEDPSAESDSTEDPTKESDSTEETGDNTKESETETAGMEDPGPKSNYEKYLPAVIIGAASLLLLIAVLICVVVKRKKANKKKEGADETESEENKENKEETLSEQKAAAEEPEQAAFIQKAGDGPVCQVIFYAVGYENIVFTLEMPEGKIMTVGRTGKADLILNPTDRKLSSVHCRMRCSGDKINVWDTDSQNGTFVNGVSVRQVGMATAKDRDVIRMGSYEYRVSIKKGVWER